MSASHAVVRTGLLDGSRLTFAIIASICIAGCATLPPPSARTTTPTSPTTTAPVDAVRDSVGTSGRFSVSSAQGQASGQFQLAAARGEISLSLFSPLGTSLAEITALPADRSANRPGQATARFSDGRELTAARLSSLLADVMPLDVPDTALLAWLQGQPAPADALPGPLSVIRESERGNVQSFTQAGWDVTIAERWPDTGLPRRMRWTSTFNGESVELRWVLDRWTTP